MNVKTLVALGLLILFSSSAGYAQFGRYNPKKGEAHPDFILPSIEDGKAMQLSDLRGKKVLLMHFASW